MSAPSMCPGISLPRIIFSRCRHRLPRNRCVGFQTVWHLGKWCPRCGPRVKKACPLCSTTKRSFSNSWCAFSTAVGISSFFADLPLSWVLPLSSLSSRWVIFPGVEIRAAHVRGFSQGKVLATRPHMESKGCSGSDKILLS